MKGEDTVNTKWIYGFHELRSKHTDLVGKKCANLGEMVHMGLNVPPGFAISVEGYERFMQETGAGSEIRNHIRKNMDQMAHVEKQGRVSRQIKDIIYSKKMPDGMAEKISQFYGRLCEETGTEGVAVAVRSSGAVSMPGQMDTFLNVQGEMDLMEKIMKVWGSAFSTRAIAFRLKSDLEIEKAPIGVAVLKMINAKSAGVTLTIQPNTGDPSKVIVEGNWGLGESVVSGEVTPDTFIIDKTSGDVQSTISRKSDMVVFKEKGICKTRVPLENQEKSCLERLELEEIVRIAKKAEAHFNKPQDMEWVLDKHLSFPRNLFWVQTRPAKYAEKRESDSEYIAELMTRSFKL